VAKRLAHDLAGLPQAASRSDRLSAIEQWGLGWEAAILNEFRLGLTTVATGETEAGARRFAAGGGRHGRGDDGVTGIKCELGRYFNVCAGAARAGARPPRG
jgi:hypothetical protein